MKAQCPDCKSWMKVTEMTYGIKTRWRGLCHRCLLPYIFDDPTKIQEGLPENVVACFGTVVTAPVQPTCP